MARHKNFSLVLILSFVGCAELSDGEMSTNCLTAKDLKDGLVVTRPANNSNILVRHRHLTGPYVATNDINSVFSDRIHITYAGLYTYKFWRNGELVQIEKPTNDFSELLKFEPETLHTVQTKRFNPSNPKREWIENYKIHIADAEDITLSGCSYSTVELTYVGTKKGTKRYIPELMLDVTPNMWGEFQTIRKRNITDGWKWPFNSTPVDALEHPNSLPTDIP